MGIVMRKIFRSSSWFAFQKRKCRDLILRYRLQFDVKFWSAQCTHGRGRRTIQVFTPQMFRFELEIWNLQKRAKVISTRKIPQVSLLVQLKSCFWKRFLLLFDIILDTEINAIADETTLCPAVWIVGLRNIFARFRFQLSTIAWMCCIWPDRCF